MDITGLVNCCFGWFLVILAVIGYFITYKKRGERWAFWGVLALGWGFFALSQTLLLAGVVAGTYYIIAFWLSSFVLIIFSMILMFLKLVKRGIRNS